MRRFASEFIRRGLPTCGLGPIVLAILYLVMQQQGRSSSLTVNEVCMGIFSLSALAFVAGGMNAVYQIERLPLMAAILAHGGVLYLSYLAVYLLNGWLKRGIVPIFVFSAVFVVGYLVIWVIIYTVTRQKTRHLNELLREKQRSLEKE